MVTVKDFIWLCAVILMSWLWIQKKTEYDDLFEKHTTLRLSYQALEDLVEQTSTTVATQTDTEDNLHNHEYLMPEYLLHPMPPMWAHTATESAEDTVESEDAKLDKLIAILDKRYLLQKDAARLYQSKTALSEVFKNGRRPNNNMEDKT